MYRPLECRTNTIAASGPRTELWVDLALDPGHRSCLPGDIFALSPEPQLVLTKSAVLAFGTTFTLLLVQGVAAALCDL